MEEVLGARTVEDQIQNYVKLLEATIANCEIPSSKKIMTMIQMRLKSAKQKKEFRRMAVQSSLFRMITNNYKSPNALSPRPKEHTKMPDLNPKTLRKHILDDIKTHELRR